MTISSLAVNPTPFDALSLLALQPAGFQVRGTHHPESAEVLPELRLPYAKAREHWLQTIASNPASFNGHRAILTGFRVAGDTLELATAYRTYADGRALKDALSDARAQGFDLPSAWLKQPHAAVSWGFSLLTAVLLPGNYLLCGQRGEKLLENPRGWAGWFTEVIEPGDIHTVDMSGLARRLISEELPALQGIGVLKFVGLGLRKASYTWQLFCVLDLRSEGCVEQQLSGLVPTEETMSWGLLPLDPSTPYTMSVPETFQQPTGVSAAELSPTLAFLAAERD